MKFDYKQEHFYMVVHGLREKVNIIIIRMCSYV